MKGVLACCTEAANDASAMAGEAGYSTNTGPGRYDPRYEEEGVDYPIGHVRWTAKRNMEAFLQLLASGAINVAPLIERRCSVEQGGVAYQELKSTGAYTRSVPALIAE